MTARFIQAHRTLARLFVRGPVKAWVSRRVWAEAMADPSFTAALEQGKADLAAGRFVKWAPEPGDQTALGRVVRRSVEPADPGYVVTTTYRRGER